MSATTDFKESWYGRIVVAVFRFCDQCVNGFVHGDFHHSLSAYLGKNNPECALCQWLSKNIERDHCRKAAKAEGLM